MELIVDNPKGKQPLRHLVSFTVDAQGFRLHDERVEDQKPDSGKSEPSFYYRRQDGYAVANTADQEKKRSEVLWSPDLSILTQLREPQLYPQITYLADTYQQWPIYREWTFGRNCVFREPQRADVQRPVGRGFLKSRPLPQPLTKNAES